MRSFLKIRKSQLDDIRVDLKRRHSFAYERIGFLTAGATLSHDGSLILLAREYFPVEDQDYVSNPTVGACIGAEAMRKGVQRAYQTKSSLIHIHMHGGFGRPEFSHTDLNSGKEFVPSFFNAVPQMPHGLMVLSADSARMLLWQGDVKPPKYLTGFISVGAPYQKFGE